MTDEHRGRAVLLAMLMTLAPFAGADDDEADYEQARRLLANGQILPLAEIVERVDVPPGARLLDLELENENGRWEYELEYLVGGQVKEFKIDAATGIVREEEEYD